jgi:hypothetical protein
VTFSNKVIEVIFEVNQANQRGFVGYDPRPRLANWAQTHPARPNERTSDENVEPVELLIVRVMTRVPGGKMICIERVPPVDPASNRN